MAEGLPKVGEMAPTFTAETSTGETVSSEDFRGRKAVLLMFYPADDTPGCTRQMCAARDQGEGYQDAGIVRFGVNHGTLASHRKFVDKYALDFPLLVDRGAEIAARFGVRKENGGTARATVLIDREGRIAFAQPGAHDVVDVVGALDG